MFTRCSRCHMKALCKVSSVQVDFPLAFLLLHSPLSYQYRNWFFPKKCTGYETLLNIYRTPGFPGITIRAVILNPLKWSNTLKQFVGNLPTNCLSVSDHFTKLVLKVLPFTTDWNIFAQTLHPQVKKKHRYLNLVDSDQSNEQFCGNSKIGKFWKR